MQQSQELVRGSSSLQKGSKGQFLVCLPARLRRRERLQCMRPRRETSKQRLMHCTISKRLVTRIILILLTKIVQDVRGCIEQLQTIETEVQNLQQSQKNLAKHQNDLEGKVIEKNELSLRQQVSYPYPFLWKFSFLKSFNSVSVTSLRMHKSDWKEHKSMLRIRNWQANGQLNAYRLNMIRWSLREEKMISRSRKCGMTQTKWKPR